jgi:SPP1 family phage portal protein
VKIKILDPKDNEFYPLYDEFDDMIAFIRKYTAKYNNTNTSMIDLYTNEYTYHLISGGSGYIPTEGGIVSNISGKIPVIYYRQPFTEWYDVQSLIEQREKGVSNLGESNVYFGAPKMFATGNITGFASKGEQGQVYMGDKDSDMKILTAQNSSESSKLEMDILEKGIFSLSQTPDLSFESMKGLGPISASLMEKLFFDAHLCVREKEMVFGLGIQRRVNLLKAIVGKVIATSLNDEASRIDIAPVFKPYIPEDITEQINTLSIAKTAGIISLKTALEKNPLVNDVDVELTELGNESVQGKAGESWTM